MKKEIDLAFTNTTLLAEKVMGFFNHFDFVLISNRNGSLKFKRCSTALDAWKTNPLKWGSEITVSISENNLSARFLVETGAQMNTKEEKRVWQIFIENFEVYLTTGLLNSANLISAIEESKRSRMSYIAWAVSGAFVGGLVALISGRLTNMSATFSFVLIPILATTFLRWRIARTKIDEGQ